MVSTRYQILFTITFQHDYYADAPFTDLLIRPDEATITQFQNCRMIYRVQQNKVTVLVQTVNNKPFISLEDGTLFRFIVSLGNGSFFNFTALKMLGKENKTYYFTNRANNKLNNRCYLSAPMPLYKNTEVYEMGAVVKKGTRVFECIKGNDPGNKHDTADTAYWRDIVAHQAALLEVYQDTRLYQPGERVKEGNTIYECLQQNGPANTQALTATEFWQPTNAIAYVNDSDLTDPLAIPGEAIPFRTFAVVDIGIGIGEQTTYALVNAGGDITPADYVIRFKNRSTTWKYISRNKSITAITDTGNRYNFSNAAVNNEFVADAPIPLTATPIGTIKMNAVVNSRPLEITGIPNAVAGVLVPSGNNHDYQLYSEIYLNY